MNVKINASSRADINSDVVIVVELLPALYDMATPEPVPPAPKARPIGRDSYPLYEMFNREAQGQLLADAVLRDTPYPIRAVMLVASNALVTSQGTQRLEEAVRRRGRRRRRIDRSGVPAHFTSPASSTGR